VSWDEHLCTRVVLAPRLLLVLLQINGVLRMLRAQDGRLARLADRFFILLLVDDVLRVFKELFSLVYALESERVVQFFELLPQVWVRLVFEHFFDLIMRQTCLLDELRALVALAAAQASMVGLLGVYDELLEGEEHLHPLLVHLRLHNVL